MLNNTDRLHARFNMNDPVAFGQQPQRTGTIIRINRTTATVRSKNSKDQYRVPFECLTHLAPEQGKKSEKKVEAVAKLAVRLLSKHQLKDWSFKFDHSTRRAGCCNYRDRQISIAFELARNGSEPDICDTLLHEIAHALVGKNHNHNAVWKTAAQQIGCSGARTHRMTFSTPRYSVRCENKCWQQTAERRNPRLRCRTCGGKLIYTPFRHDSSTSAP